MLSALVAAMLAVAASQQVDISCPPGADTCVVDVGFEGSVTSDVADFVEAAVETAADFKATAILLRISSGGGDVAAGARAAAAIRVSVVPVHCWVGDLAASSAAWILEACQQRVVGPKALVVIHRPQVEVNASVVTETALRRAADSLRAVRHTMFADIAARIGRAEASIDAHTVDEKDWVMAGEEVVAEGFADRVATLAELRASLRSAVVP